MEFLNPQILSGTSPCFSPKKHRYKYNIAPKPSFKRNSSFPTYYLPLHNSRNFQIFAHFGRPTSRHRRNSLRKKLTFGDQQEQEQVCLSDFQNPNRSFDDNLNCDSDSVIDSSRLINVETEEFKSKRSGLGESVLWDKLENWVEQYRKDIKDWGIGSAPIFTVFEELEGNVKWVSVNEDEIVRRSRGEDSTEVNLKILCAQSLAREMGSGKNNVIPRNSSVAKFVVQGGESAFFKAIQGFTLRPELFPMMSSVGRLVLFGFVALWALKKLFSFGDKEVRHTEVEKEMMRRKIKSRKEKEMLEKFSVEVVQQTPEPIQDQKPMIDKEQLMNSILKAKAGSDKSALQDASAIPTAKSIDLDNRIQDIRQMARHARDIEGQELSLTDQDAKEKQGVNNELSNEMELVNVLSDDDKSSLGQTNGIHETVKTGNLDIRKIDDSGFLSKVSSTEDNMQGCTTSGENVSSYRESSVQGFKDSESALKLTDTTEVIQFSDTPYAESHMSRKGSSRTKTRVILSLKEARDYLSEKFHNQVPDIVSQVKTLQESDAVLRHPGDEGFGRRNTGHKLDVNDKVAAISGRTSNSTHSTKACKVSAWKESVPTNNEYSEDSEARCGVGDLGKPQTSLNHEGNGINAGTGPPAKTQNWIDTNFHEVEPLVKKIGTGFKDNYMVAREKVNEQLDMDTEITQLAFNGDDSELEWMKDDDLREIVFQVRENELAGRDPFYLMDAEDKRVFFMGLEKKVEKENEKLLKLHELLHSNIENLDYGAGSYMFF